MHQKKALLATNGIKRFDFQSSVYNGYHDISMMSSGINSFVILYINGVDCRYVIAGLSKSETIILLRHANFNLKSRSLYVTKFLLLYMKYE